LAKHHNCLFSFDKSEWTQAQNEEKEEVESQKVTFCSTVFV
jgi:hypothetical protein